MKVQADPLKFLHRDYEAPVKMKVKRVYYDKISYKNLLLVPFSGCESPNRTVNYGIRIKKELELVT